MFTGSYRLQFILLFWLISFVGCATQTHSKFQSLQENTPSAELRETTLSQNAGDIRVQLDLQETVYMDSSEAHQARLNRFMESQIQISEKDKIRFLLDSIRTSGSTFIRNGVTYNALQASEWLRWKSHHRQFRDHPIVSGKDFVSRVATRSNHSREHYKIVAADGRKHRLGEILLNELSALEAAIRSRIVKDMANMEVKATPPALNYVVSANVPPQASSATSILAAPAAQAAQASVPN